jgi:hypothetical protein
MSQGGPLGKITYVCRKCLSKFFSAVAPPDLAPEVVNLLAELNFSNRDVNHLYRIFQQMRQHDPITVGTLEFEVCTSSLLMLVRTDRDWIQKIMYGLIELGGYNNIVPWDGFLFVSLRFCSLSKIELCQVLFFIIAKQQKSWSLHTLTNSQLEEFYDDWNNCPISSFDTGTIGFDKLPRTRYGMVDFIELCTLYGPLINPVLHLQRSMQQSVPGLRFWGDYDRIKVQNRFIPLDFFRYRKSTSLAEMLHESDIKLMEKELRQAQDTYGEMNLRVLQEEEGLLPKSEDLVHDQLHLPLPGTRTKPPHVFVQHPAPDPEWMQDAVKNNKDPTKGLPLGSAVPPIPKDKRPVPQVAKLIVYIGGCSGLPMPEHCYCTCEIEHRAATRVQTKTKFSSNPRWEERHEIYGYIVDDTKRLEFNVWEASLLLKLHLAQHQFYPHGFDGALTYPGGKLDIAVEVTLPKTVSDAKDMVLSTFGEEARLARQKAELRALVGKLKVFQERKRVIARVQELDFIQRSRVGEAKRKNLAVIVNGSRPEELIDRPGPLELGRKH